MIVLPGFKTGFGDLGEAFDRRRTAKRTGRHGPARVSGEPAHRHGQGPAHGSHADNTCKWYAIRYHY